MGQKINPNLLQLTKNNNWKSKYFEKISSECSIYSQRDKEIRNFVVRFFKISQLILHNCRLYFFNKSLHIFISYHSNLNSFSHKIKKNALDRFKLKCYNLKKQIFFQKLFESLTSFTKKKINFFLVLKELKFNIKQIILNAKIKTLIKKNIASLRKYQTSKFFKQGINILFNCASNRKSSNLLAKFIAVQLKNLKRHNFFIRFIQNTLKSFKNNQFFKFKGIKIEIKGRLNRRPRARNKIIKISNSVSVLTIDSIIDYSEEIAFTLNGTIGIKVWIHEF